MSKAKIITWNVNGIRAILKKNFAKYIDQLKPDVLALQEVKCDDLTILNQIFTELGYSYYVNCAVKKGYSGVLVAWKNFLKAELVPFDLLNNAYKNEGRTLFVDFGDFKLLNLYVPSGTSSEERHEAKLLFMRELRSNLSNAELSKIIICGDFNICHKENDIHHPQIAEKKNFSGYELQE
jgi:exodeoxyribonuclease-3